jgi:RNA polymerase sigma factor (sigma-70 family)
VNDGEARSPRSPTDLEQWLDELLAAHGAALSRLASSYVRRQDEREDLLQEIVVAIWRALPRFRRESSERTFLFRIAHNRAITYVARRRTSTVDDVIAQSVLYVLILIFDLAWIYSGSPERARDGLLSFLTGRGVVWVWLVTAALGAAAVTHRRRLADELEILTALRRQLEDPLSDAEGE